MLAAAAITPGHARNHSEPNTVRKNDSTNGAVDVCVHK
jgi:hypothetical protein